MTSCRPPGMMFAALLEGKMEGTEVSYVPQMMMAIVAASAALFGVTVIVINQIRRSALPAKAKKWPTILLVFTFLFGGLAIVFAISWLSSPSVTDRLVALFSFGVQIIWFLMVVCTFWLRETAEDETLKAGYKDSDKTRDKWKKLDAATVGVFLGVLAWSLIRRIREGRKKETRD